MKRITTCLTLTTLIVFAASGTPTIAAPIYRGVNLAGAEFTPNQLPGNYNGHYTYPTQGEINYFTGKGANTFRLPFLWERLQRSLNGDFHASELARVQQFVDNATSRGAYVVLDPHNYARYQGAVIGSAAVPNAAFSDFWSRLASTFKTNDHVIFGLMNEPNNMPSTEQWVTSAIPGKYARHLNSVLSGSSYRAKTLGFHDANASKNPSPLNKARVFVPPV